MKVSDEFKMLLCEQDGLFSTKQAAVYAGMSRQSLSGMVDRGVMERIDHGLYYLCVYPEPENTDIIAAGLRCAGRGAISHISALVYYNLGMEVAYSMHVMALDGFDKRALRVCDSLSVCAVSKHDNKQYPLTIDQCNMIGDVAIVKPARALFDCVMEHMIQVESIAMCLASGQIDMRVLTDDQKLAFDKNIMVQYALEQPTLGMAM